MEPPTGSPRRRLAGLLVVLGLVLVGAFVFRSYWKTKQEKINSVASQKAALEGMPIIGYALSKDGRNYTAYLRWVYTKFPQAKDQHLSECRLRFSLEKPGPPGFAIRGWGKPLTVPATHPASFPRCEIWPIPESVDEDASPRRPVALPAGVGDFDGRRSGYNDQGCMVYGDVQIRDGLEGKLVADARVDWTGTRGGDIVTDAAAFRFSLEPIADEANLKVLRKGETADSQAHVWDKYQELLAELVKPRYRTLPLGAVTEYKPDAERVTVFLRRDMDLTMYGALQMAEYEAKAGIKVTYLVNLASTIYSIQSRNGRFRVGHRSLETLHRLQQLGHEIGWQNDMLAQRVEYNTPIQAWTAFHLGGLRQTGLPVISEAANGSPYCDTHKSHNIYIYRDYRQGGWLERKDRRGTNGFEEGVVKVDRDGRIDRYPLPDWKIEDNGIRMSADALPDFLNPKPANYRYLYDVVHDPAAIMEGLRAAKPGDVIQLMTHDNRWTTMSQGLDLTVDPAFAKYYVEELRETKNP